MAKASPNRTIATPLVVRSAASAYRADLAGRDAPFGTQDDGWIALGALLGHAALLPAEHRMELLRDAIELATDMVPDADLERYADYEWNNRDRWSSEAV